MHRLLLVVLLALSACSYGFQQGQLREGLDSVAVPFFENRSREPDVEVELTEAVVAGLIADRTLRVVDESNADAIVQGVLRSYEFIESFFGADRQTEEYKIRIVVEVTMIERGTQEILAGPQRVTGEGTYLLEDGPDGELEAREIAAAEIVEGILNMVIEEW